MMDRTTDIDTQTPLSFSSGMTAEKRSDDVLSVAPLARRGWPVQKWDGTKSAAATYQNNNKAHSHSIENFQLPFKAKVEDSSRGGESSMPEAPSASAAAIMGRKAQITQLVQNIRDFNNGNSTVERPIDAAFSMLHYAHYMVDEAAKTIEDQKKRIDDLQALTTTDDLTRLYNRRGFEQAFEKEIDRCNRSQSEGGLLILIDLDNFRSINENYGYDAGDACLKKVGKILQNQVRLMDVAARINSDEFVILMANTTKQDAAARAQDLAWQLGHLSMEYQGIEIPIRASLGLRSYAKGSDINRIFDDADRAMQCHRGIKTTFGLEEGDA